MDLLFDRFLSKIGTILLVHDENGCLRALDFEDFADRVHRLLRLHYGQVWLPDAVSGFAVEMAQSRCGYAGPTRSVTTLRQANTSPLEPLLLTGCIGWLSSMSALHSTVRRAQGSRSDRRRRLGLEQAERSYDTRVSKAAAAFARMFFQKSTACFERHS